MKNYVVTGASGMVATELIYRLKDDYVVYAVSTDPRKIMNKYVGSNVICLTLDDLINRAEQEQLDFCTLIHCAFARSKNGKDIASSLDYLNKVLKFVRNGHFSTFINISSQSVYGQKEPPLWNESTPVDPDYLYAIGKYASEIITNTALSDIDVRFTNIRLASVSEKNRFLGVFIQNAVKGIPIKVMGGKQSCSFIDVRDVADALTIVATSPDSLTFDRVYNLGTGKTRTIAELAEDIKQIYKAKYGKDAIIVTEDADIKLDVGMDNTLFCQTFNWSPRYGYDDMIEEILIKCIEN